MNKFFLIGLTLLCFTLLFGCTSSDTFIIQNTKLNKLFDGNISGDAGLIPFINLDGNLLEVSNGFDFNKDTNTLSTNCVMLGDGNSYCSSTDFPNPDLSGLIPKAYGVSTSSASTNSKSVTIADYTPVAGDIIAIKFTYGSTTSSNWDLLINGVWYNDVWVGGSTITADYLLFSANAVVLFYYDGKKMSVVNPTYTNPLKWVTLAGTTERPAETIYGYKLAWKDGNNRYRPIIKTTGTTGNNDMPNTVGFRLGSNMVINSNSTTYGTSTIMAKGFNLIGDIGTAYNFNSAFTAWLPVYFKGTVNQTDGLFYFNQANGYTGWYTQTLPTSEDGFVYVYVGNAWTTYGIGLSLNHPAYEFKDGMIRLYGEAKNTHQDNFKENFGTDNDSSITFDGNNLVLDPDTTGTDSGLVYVDGNVSATGFITRTSVYDKSKGSALDKIKDADSLVNVDKSIIHENFFGYTPIQVTDYSRPVIITKNVNNCFFDEKDKEFCEIEKVSTITYPYTKIEGGVDLGMEIDVLRQAVFELKTELCKKDSSYEWCKVIK